MNDETIHGFLVVNFYRLRNAPGRRPGRIVLVDRGHAYEHRQRFVTAWQGINVDTRECDSEWSGGNYFNTLDAAVGDFHFRCRKGW